VPVDKVVETAEKKDFHNQTLLLSFLTFVGVTEELFLRMPWRSDTLPVSENGSGL